MTLRVLFVPAYAPAQLEMASSRQRVYQFLPRLGELGIHADVLIPPIGSVVGQFVYRWQLLKKVSAFDLIFIQKKLFPVWWLELVRRRNPNLIYDLDDALFLANPGAPASQRLQATLSRRLDWVLERARHVIVCNRFLADHVRRLNPNVSILPTCVDTALFYPRPCRPAPEGVRLILGWTGSGEQHLVHLGLLRKPLEILAQEFPIELRLIGTMDSEQMRVTFQSSPYPVKFVDWLDPQALPDELACFDIGLMPLVDDDWSRGKCAFKALLYMAMGLPTVASPVGMNLEVIRDGENGFFAHDESEWVLRIREMANQSAVRARVGIAAAATVKERFSLDCVAPQLAATLVSVANSLQKV